MVDKEVCWLLDKIVVLKDKGKMNLFADFPIGATIQDGGKRKRSDGDMITSISYIWREHNIIKKTIHYTMNVLSTEAKLFT